MKLKTIYTTAEGAQVCKSSKSPSYYTRKYAVKKAMEKGYRTLQEKDLKMDRSLDITHFIPVSTPQ